MSIQRDFIVVGTGVNAPYANLSANIYIGNSTVYNSINSTALIAVGSTLTVIGNTTFNNNVTLSSNLSVQGSQTNINSTNFSVSGISAFTGNTTFSGDLTVNGNTTLGDAATDGITIRANTVTVQSNASFNSGLLYLDTLNSRVGFGTNAPSARVSVAGDVSVTGNVVAGNVVANSVLSTAVNTALFSVGTLFTANSTLVNAAALNVTGQVNTATLFATTSANVGANVQVNTSGVNIGNNSSNVTITSTAVTISDAAQTATINSTSFTGNANSATYLAGAGATAFVSNSALQSYNYANATSVPTAYVSNSALQGYGYLTGATTYVSNSALQGYAFVNSTSGTAFNASSLNSQPASYYTNATNLATGTVPTARLGSGTANSTTYLAGDQTWKTITTGSGSALAGNVAGVLANSTAYYINSSNGVVANSTGLFLVAGTGVTVNTSGISIAQAITTTSSVRFGSFGVGTAASGTTGEIRATNNITAYYSSDKRFKENVAPIVYALQKVIAIGGKTFDWTDEYIKEHGGEDGYFVRKSDFGVIAQDVERVFSPAVRKREDGTLAVDYEKLVALAFQAIVEQQEQIDELKAKLGG